MTGTAARRLAAGLAATACALVLALEPMRAVLPLPDLAWAGLFVALLVSAAALGAANLPSGLLRRAAPLRRLWAGRALVLLGATALGAGGVASSPPAAGWPADARAAAALSVLLACALLPGGYVMARRAHRERRHAPLTGGPARSEEGT